MQINPIERLHVKFVRVHPNRLAVSVDGERQAIFFVLEDRVTHALPKRLIDEIALLGEYAV
ncbi:MAG TPA: hypothetical protein VNZ26_24905 [Vicinamibacterales bacterium]|nr:hypothetical protein [Vicinamibacterales bacterium]